MSIDWTKAPEGATHWEPSSYEFAEGWMRKVGDKWSYWLEGSKVWGLSGPACCVSAEREATFEARPQETWDGKCLPPVGTVCEVKHRDIGWVRCEIVAHKSFSCGGLTHAIAWIDENTLDQSQGLRFRQLRTPEQIAAEEREKAIEEMCFAVETLTVKQAKALFDAGYRRQEEGK
ncbi:hypothetical protein KK198_16045 [Pseudomonas aeruginosa]|uniref:hypothetical protein n=1 Tax=Pseudomonas aeruginosa TaxID=287 RepID=UPI000F544F3A|nr:hypothetical protein [Pseudomonas aeruginosa]RPX30131.1 hypothetical protein IPC725_27660 [Pseudomonas aeruginosa]WCV82380.1 hypothetical protein KK198_16045 [Pseudomonas aeruginosa]